VCEGGKYRPEVVQVKMAWLNSGSKARWRWTRRGKGSGGAARAELRGQGRHGGAARPSMPEEEAKRGGERRFQ
jgi:hypothetical protein